MLKKLKKFQNKIYNKFLESKEFIINDIKINYIRLLVPEAVDVGTDDKNIYERVIQAIFYYEKKKRRNNLWQL